VAPTRDSAVVRSLLLAAPPLLNEAAKSEGLVVDRRAFIGTVAGGLFAAPLAAEAQRAAKVPAPEREAGL